MHMSEGIYSHIVTQILISRSPVTKQVQCSPAGLAVFGLLPVWKQLSYFRLNQLPTLYIRRLSFRYAGLCDLDIPIEKGQNYLQTVETLLDATFCGA